MNICLVTETYPPEINGVAMTVSRLVTGLSRRHHVEVIRPPQHREDEYRHNDSAAEIPVPGVRIPLYPDLRIGLPCTSRIIARWQDPVPDVVYIATEGPLGLSALNAARRMLIPVVSGFHTNFRQYSRHYHLGLLSGAVNAYLRWFHHRTLMTLAPAQDLVESLRDDGYGNVRLMGRGVDTELYNPCRRNEKLRATWTGTGDTQVMLYVGRLAREKNVSDVISIYRSLQHDLKAVKLVMVGDGPMRRRLAWDNPDVIFCGWKRGAELAVHYASADLFLFPSQSETFGNVVFEAMASGLPVVAYDYAAAGAHITNGINGLLATKGDVHNLRQQCRRLFMDRPLAAAIRRSAVEYVTQHGWSTIVTGFEALLKQASECDMLARSHGYKAV
jgi:glycosyltransferase involved in cell wall biosynthesis